MANRDRVIFFSIWFVIYGFLKYSVNIAKIYLLCNYLMIIIIYCHTVFHPSMAIIINSMMP